jgi:hypothetical protein
MKTSVLIILTVTVHSRNSGCHEQRLQERAARLVRSDGHRTAPHKNWVGLSFGKLRRGRTSAEPHAVIDLDQIVGAAAWARVVLSGRSD